MGGAHHSNTYREKGRHITFGCHRPFSFYQRTVVKDNHHRLLLGGTLALFFGSCHCIVHPMTITTDRHHHLPSSDNRQRLPSSSFHSLLIWPWFFISLAQAGLGRALRLGGCLVMWLVMVVLCLLCVMTPFSASVVSRSDS